MKERPTRKHNRLIGYDYSSQGAYFITVCSKNRELIFGDVVGADIIRPGYVDLNENGKLVETAINAIPQHYPNIVIDKYIIMPNHIHMIIVINEKEANKKISTVIGQMKRWVSKEIGESVWQKTYHDHIIRDEEDYLTKWKYIDDNPSKWNEDDYFTQRSTLCETTKKSLML